MSRVSRARYRDHPLMLVLRVHLEAHRDGDGRPLTARTVEEYLGVARLGLAAGDLLEPLRRATNRGRYLNVRKAYKHIVRAAQAVQARAQAGQSADARLGIQVLDLMERAEKVERPPNRPVARPTMPLDEWQAILAGIKKLPAAERDSLFVLLRSGLRINDWFGVTRRQAREAATRGRTVIRQKGDRLRPWEVGDSVQARISSLLAVPKQWSTIRDLYGSDYPKAYHAVRVILRDLAVSIGIADRAPHRYRHALATRMRAEKIPLDVIQATLGHESIETTKIYVDEVPPEEIRDALNKVDRRIDGGE